MDQRSIGNSDTVLGMEVEYELKLLREKISNLEKENIRLHQLLVENDVTVEGLPTISDEEYICTAQIKKLRESSDVESFTGEEAKIFDILHKNLKLARGEVTLDGKRKKKLPASELLKIVDGKE